VDECKALQVGFFHSDPHPGNLMKITDPSGYGGRALYSSTFAAERKHYLWATRVHISA
jgi:predicted unusual protein kinase regulating ubiquinone biosynthesis (AarF/ABC1/UbiB family)